MRWRGRMLARLAAYATSEEAQSLSLAGARSRWTVYASRVKGGFACLGVLLLFGAQGGQEREISCLALNIYFEARLEPEEGRRAVAHVVMNRVADRRWPDSPCAVIRQEDPQGGRLCQFSWYCDGRSNRPHRDGYWTHAVQLAEKVYWGRSEDPTGGALWYHATYVQPRWRVGLAPGPRIGSHVFYRDGP